MSGIDSESWTCRGPCHGSMIGRRPAGDRCPQCRNPAPGLGADIALIQRITAEDTITADLLDQALQNPNAVHNVHSRPSGNTRTTALRRLRKDAPELPPAGPFATEAQARSTPQVRAVYARFGTAPGPGSMDAFNARMITTACDAAGIELGGYDRRVVARLAGFEPAMCAAIAGWITRAARTRPGTRR